MLHRPTALFMMDLPLGRRAKYLPLTYEDIFRFDVQSKGNVGV
jgi:hypothetical protein